MIVLVWMIAGALFTQPVMAQSTPPDAGDDRYRWVEYVTSSYSKATVTGKSGGSTNSISHKHSAYQVVTDAVRSLLSVRDDLQSTLKPFVKQQIDSLNDGVVLRNWYFRASGPITVQLTAKGGLVEASVGGFSINTSFKAKQADLLYAKVNVRTNTIWLDGSYDPLSGRIFGLSLSPSVVIDIDVDADGLLGVLNTYLELRFGLDFEEIVEEIFRDGVYSALNSLGSQERMVFGINRVLESADFSHLGVDLAQVVLDVMKLLEGDSVTITTTEENKSLVGTGTVRCGSRGWYEGSPKSLYLVGITVSTSAGYSLQVTEAVDTDFRVEFLGTCGDTEYN